ncbi:NADP-dependent oxidoreductase domain containing protein, partial [Hyaloscypha variabilis]
LYTSSTMHPPLSSLVPQVILGGAGFSDHHVLDPTALPTRAIISRAFDLGVRCFDTSPYYGPSEILLGDAFSQPQVTAHYHREDYILMTKVGRISADKFNYSREWVHYSVNRSLERLQTAYLDVVFCHDVDFVTDEDTLEAVGALRELVTQGKVRYVGISGYSISTLARVARKVQQRYACPLDAVQNWAQMTLQNTRLAKEGLKQFREAGVDCVFNSSPLAVGLLRSGGVPVGNLGDFHPAPAGLRAAAQQAAQWVTTKGETLASVALRFSIATMTQAVGSDGVGGGTIFGAASIAELEENMGAAESILVPLNPGQGNVHGGLRHLKKVSTTRLEQDLPLYTGVQEILGSWIDY